MDSDSPFDWRRQESAEKLCLDLLARFRQENRVLAGLAGEIEEETSGHLLDWVDHLCVRPSPSLRGEMAAAGFAPEEDWEGEVWHHPGAILPRLVPADGEGAALKVESLPDFLQVRRLAAGIEGEPFAPYRRAVVSSENGVALLAVERRGSGSLRPESQPEGYLRDYFGALECWQSRKRGAEDEDAAMEDALARADALVERLGADLAAHVVCEGERRYWYSRNQAGRIQKGRQDALGLGWSNADHHTFRSSRRRFRSLVELFSRLGFHCRERFYAGEEAGWGAQLMENAAGITLFLDVDLAPEEVETDFAREGLPERRELGTVGMWCALHGDSINGAGMHHLAARFDFDRLRADLARYGVEYMTPFSNFPYLRQAFSVAERWGVDPRRVERLVGERRITGEQGERFLAGGAVGSHLENIERREGYKGFNKMNVSLIIRETDPRR